MLAESCGFRLRTRFGDDRDPNLQMLFQHSGDAGLTVDPDNVQRTLDDLKRSDPLPYHLRVRYVTDRMKKLGSYAKEILEAKGFVEDVVRKCGEQKSAENSDAVKKAA